MLLLSIMIRHAAVGITLTELPSAKSQTAPSPSSGTSADGTYDWSYNQKKSQFTNSGYYPASFSIYTDNCNGGNANSFHATLKDEFAGGLSDTMLYAGDSLGASCSYSIVSRAAITSVFVCADINDYVQDIRFNHSDGTTTKATANVLTSCPLSYTITLTGKIQGFHFQTYTRTAKSNGAQTHNIVGSWFTVFVDSDPCSMVEATNPPTPTAMTITVSGPAVSQTLQDPSTYAFTYSKTSCTFTSKSYGGLAPSLTFFSLSSLTLSGSTTNSANVQVTTMSLYIDLKPYKRQVVTFVLTVMTAAVCTIDAPVISPVTYTYEIGINTQPINMAWTQTAASQSCSAVPSVVSLPSETFFTLTSVSATGGNLTINGATLPKIGSYTVTLKNTLTTQVKFIDVTIILKDPCARAIFEVSPSPFSDIAVTVPSATSINTAFKVWTDVERSNNSIVCAITASFTTTYTPISVASPYVQTVVNPALVSLPTDIAQGPTSSHPVTILITNTLWPATTTAESFSFDVVVTCTVTSLTLTSTQADYNYELKQGPYTTASYTAGQTSACNHPYTFTVYHYQNDVFVDIQNVLFDSTSGKFTLSYTNAALIDTKQTYVLRATIPQIDPGTSDPMYVEKILNIYIKANCENSTIVDKTINDMNILVTQSTTQNVSFQDSTAVTWSIPNKCGTKVYSFSPSLSFLTVASSIMTLSTSNPTDIGSWDVTMTVSLNSFPTITRIKVFKVTVVCQVKTLGFSTNPTNIFIEPGVTTQPQYSPFVSSRTPACANTVSYSFSTTPPVFTSLDNLAFSSGQIKADGAVLANKGVYSLMLVASVDGQTSNTSFTITIQDPCSRAIFQTTPGLSDMTMIRNFDTSKTQTFYFKTDIEVTHSLVCGITATLLTPASYPYVSLSGLTISVDPSLTSATDVGLHTISIEATSTLYPGSVTAKTYTFVLDIQHCVVSTMSLAAITDVLYQLNQGALAVPFTAASWSSLACLYTASYTASYAKGGLSISQPAWITFTPAGFAFSVNSTSALDLGEYDITLTASIPQPSIGVLGVKTVSQTFKIKIEIDCNYTILIDLTITDMTIRVTEAPKTQSIEFLNTEEQLHGIPGLCGTRQFVWTPSLPAFLVIDASLTTLTLATSNVSDVGVYNLSFTVSLADYPSVESIEKPLTINIICEVFTLTFSPVPSNIFAETGVTGPTAQPLTSGYGVMQTPACANPVTFTIIEATKPSFVDLQNLSALTGEIKVDGALLADQNVYSLTLQAVVDSQTITTPFTVTIQDPCKRAVFENSPAPSSMLLIRDFDPTQTQTFTLKTDVEVAYSLVCAYTATLLTPAAYPYVSLTGSTIQVNPALTSAADVGLHNISIQATSALYPGSVTAKTYTFGLDIQHCVVTTMTLDPIASQVYTINDPLKTISFTAASWSDLACLYAVTYTASAVQSGSSISMPSFITFNATSRTFDVYATLPAAIGVYDITVTASIPQPSDTSGVKIVSQTFVLTVGNDCLSTILNDLTISDMIVKVSQSTSQSVEFTNTKSLTYANPDYCGLRKFDWSQIQPSYLSISADLKTLTLATNNPADEGTFLFDLTVSLASYPVVSSIAKTIKITIICEVFTLTFSPTPFNIFAEIGVTGPTAQPLTSAFATTQTPACANLVTFTIVEATKPSFVNLQNLSVQGGEIKVDGAMLADKNVYSLTLQAVVDSQTITTPFTVTIQDPCKRAVFENSPAPSSMVLIRDFDPTQTQTFTLKTDVEVAYSLVCAYTATLLTPLAYSYVSLTGSTIQVNPALTSAADVGLHNISIQATSALYPGSVTAKTYTFGLNIQHCVVSTMNLAAIADVLYYLNQGERAVPFTAVTWSSLACLHTATYTASYAKGGSTITQPAWITFTPAGLAFSVDSTSASDLGVYDITLTASIPQPPDGSGVGTFSRTFKITIEKDCLSTSLIDLTITDMTIRVTEAPKTQSIEFLNTKAQLHGIPGFCGARQFIWTPNLPTFLVMDASLTTLTLATSNFSDVGVYNLSFTVSLVDYPTVPSIEKQVSITINCEVQSISVVKDPSLWNPYSYKIGIDAPLIIGFSFDEFPKCGGLTFTVVPALPFISLSSANKTLTVETNGLMNSGAFDLKVYATPALGVSSSVDINLNMIDICETTKIQSQKITSIRAFLQDPEYKPQQSISLNEFTYEAKALKVDCGTVLLSLHERNTTDSRLMQVSQWIQLKELSIQVDLQKLTDAGSHKFELTAYLQNYPDIKTEMTFTVSQSGSQITCPSSMDQTYELGAPPISFGINYRNLTVNEDGVKLTPVRKPVALDEGGNPTNLPDFISFNPVTNLFKVEKGGVKDFGNYVLALQIGYVEYPSFEVLCQTKLEMTYKPDFKGAAFTDQKFTCGDKWSMPVPKIEDVFGQQATLDVDFGDGSSIFQYASAVMKITTLDSDTKELNGNYTIAITMTDSMGSKKTQKIRVEVSCFNKLSLADLPKTKFQPESRKQVDPPKLYIEYMNNVGQLRVKFTKAIIIPTFERYPEFTNAKLMRQNCTAADAIKELCIKEDRRNLQKEIKDESKEAVDIINRGIVYVDDKYEKILDIKMKPGLASNEEKLYFSWKCVDFKSTYMDFAVNYTYFDEVSVHDLKDSIEVIVHGYYYFRSVYNNEYIEQETAIVVKQVPPQVNPNSAGALAATTATMAAASKSVMIANFVMNLLLGGAIQQLFSAIRKLTIMVHLLIVNVRIPANAQAFFAGLLSFVTFDIIELGPYIRAGLKLEETDDLTENFQNLGYQSNFFAINIGTQGIVICVLFLLLIFHVTTSGVKNEKFVRFRAIITKGLIWNNLLTFFTESYMLMSISTFTNYTEFSFNSFGTILSSNLCMLGTVIIFGFPLWLLIFLNAKKDKLHLKKTRDKYGEVYEHLAYRREGPKALLEPGLSLVRVLILMFTLIFLQEWRYFQIAVINACSTFMVVYTGLANPYTTKEKLFFEQFNECFIIILNYHLMCFANLVQDDWTRGIVGWSMMVTVGFNLIINMMYIIVGSVKDSYKNIRLKYTIWKLDRLKKKLAAKKVAISPFETAPVVFNNDQNLLRFVPETRKAKLVSDGMDPPPQLIKTKTKGEQTQVFKKRKTSRKFVPKCSMQMLMIPELEESNHESQFNLIYQQDSVPHIKELAEMIQDAEDDLEERLDDQRHDRNTMEKVNHNKDVYEPQGRLSGTSAGFPFDGTNTIKNYWENKDNSKPDYDGMFSLQKHIQREDDPYMPSQIGRRNSVLARSDLSKRSERTKRHANYDEEEKSQVLTRIGSLKPNADKDWLLETRKMIDPSFAGIYEISRNTTSQLFDSQCRTADGPSECKRTIPAPYRNISRQMVDEPEGRERSESVESFDRAVRVAARRREINNLMGAPQDAGVMFNQLWQPDRQSQQ